MALLKRDPRRRPAPAAKSWKRIDAWLRRHCPPVYRALRPGVNEAAIRKVDQALGRPLPEDVKASYRVHDSHGGVADDRYSATFFYNLPLVSKQKGTATSVVGVWQSLNEFYQSEPERLESPPPRYDWYSWRPEGFIRKVYGSPRWLPLHDDYGGNYLGVDLDPGPKGFVGQVINFGRDEHGMWVLALSWGQFLEDVADEMEAGHFEVVDYEGIWLNTPKRGPLYTQYEAWSRAKLDPRFHRVRPTPPPPPSAEPPPAGAAPEVAGQCAAVVHDFFEALHAWERH
jgi:cell wall assembly regulator SMI1